MKVEYTEGGVPYCEIEVDGKLERRSVSLVQSAYGPMRYKPEVRDDEMLLETVDGDAKIVTVGR